jgi:hypothetical protein
VRAFLVAALVLGACGATSSRPTSPARPPVLTAETIFVSCMAEPPPLVVIDWPDADSIGNVLMHTSTVDRVRGAYADLRRWVDEQYFNCLHVAERAGEQSVTVEVDP